MGDINKKTTPERGGKVVRTICEVHREIYRKVFPYLMTEKYHKKTLIFYLAT